MDCCYKLIVQTLQAVGVLATELMCVSGMSTCIVNSWKTAW